MTEELLKFTKLLRYMTFATDHRLSNDLFSAGGMDGWMDGSMSGVQFLIIIINILMLLPLSETVSQSIN